MKSHNKGGSALTAKKTDRHYFVVDINGVGKRPVFKSSKLMDANKDTSIRAFANHTVAKTAFDDKPDKVSFVITNPGIEMEEWKP